ncbi:basic phospholipase A2 acanthin-1-like [Portunus trituberculatus]|uniref:basic phospholipase A2 acanthin-1-like n=1 Tax=Portunus trituberculatus TaxID=210409 RepID=UPI001E1CB0E9|nr:basic phospholipase A2 acanthin-1-like [Portunus trituberculatus]
MSDKSLLSFPLPFLVFVMLLCFCVVEGRNKGDINASHLPRHRRSIGQFGDMIRLATQREALLYNNYGNHCGTQGGDYPVVDEVDRCCKNHDSCYDTIREGACSSSWFGPGFVRYSWSWNGTHLLCGVDNLGCRAAACECDAVAASCFARHPWNAQHKKSSIWDFLA